MDFLRLAAFALPLALGSTVVGDDALNQRIERLVAEIAPSVVQCRRAIHADPELGNRETRTAARVADQLRQLGVQDVRTGVAHHGVVALIEGGRPGPVVALRADMDALPIQEATGLPFASQNPGVMHACGHDAHTAILLGAAQVLMQIRAELPGAVKLIFQPAEEGVPAGETGGARQMVAEKVLEAPAVSAIFALHVNPDLPAGAIGYRPGTIMAAVDRFQVTIIGKQSHAAMPWQGVDSIVAASQVVTALQTIRSRSVDARKPIVVSIGKFQAGTAWNIIPERVLLEGTIRTHDAEVRQQAGELFRRIVEHTAAANGARAEIEFRTYGPETWNDPPLTRQMIPTLQRVAGQGNALEVEPSMGGEDFAHYAQKVPGVFVFLGVRNEAKGARFALHTPQMTIDEDALALGVKTLVGLAVDYLQQPRATPAADTK